MSEISPLPDTNAREFSYKLATLWTQTYLLMRGETEYMKHNNLTVH